MGDKSGETIEVYGSKGLSLLQRAATHLGLKDWADDIQGICGHIDESRPKYAKATWRIYRASLVCVLQLHGFPEEAEYIRGLSQEPCLQRTTKTSARKAKGLPPAELRKVLAALKRNRGEYDSIVRHWIICARMTGLRPVEWRTAKLHGRSLVLQNAKQSNGRSFGSQRELDCSPLSRAQFRVLATFLTQIDEKCRERGMSFAALYTASRKRLLQVNQHLGSRARRQITLYSGRHQFAANLKIMNVPPAEIAAAMGHGSDLTASRLYAKRSVGRRGKSRVRPSQKNVDAVKVRAHKKIRSSHAASGTQPSMSVRRKRSPRR